MPVLTEQRKRQRNLIIVLGLVVLVTITVLYFGRFRREIPEAGAPQEELGVSKEARAIQLNLKLLEDKRFKELVPYDKLPRDIKTGRNNPFVPYGAGEPAYVLEQMEQIEEEAEAQGAGAGGTSATTTENL